MRYNKHSTDGTTKLAASIVILVPWSSVRYVGRIAFSLSQNLKTNAVGVLNSNAAHSYKIKCTSFKGRVWH